MGQGTVFGFNEDVPGRLNTLSVSSHILCRTSEHRAVSVQVSRVTAAQDYSQRKYEGSVGHV